jgi:hypothetical protein
MAKFSVRQGNKNEKDLPHESSGAAAAYILAEEVNPWLEVRLSLRPVKILRDLPPLILVSWSIPLGQSGRKLPTRIIAGQVAPHSSNLFGWVKKVGEL